MCLNKIQLETRKLIIEIKIEFKTIMGINIKISNVSQIKTRKLNKFVEENSKNSWNCCHFKI